MLLYLVEAFVVERRHKLGIGRFAVGSIDGQSPLLLLSRRQTVAERLPCQRQLLVGQRALWLLVKHLDLQSEAHHVAACDAAESDGHRPRHLPADVDVAQLW